MTSAKAAALRPAEHFTWRSLAGLAAILVVATAFGVLLVLVRWSWPPLGRLDRTLVISLNRLVIAPLVAAARPASPAPPDSRPVIPATHRPIPLSTCAVRDRKERTCT